MTSGKVYKKSINNTGFADGETVEVSLDLPEDGFYLIQAWIAACGANALNKEGPFFLCQILNNQATVQTGSRSSFVINVAKAWDSSNVAMLANSLTQGNVTACFTSHTGGQLSTTYTSNFGICLIKL